jgi:hypothetical protein
MFRCGDEFCVLRRGEGACKRGGGVGASPAGEWVGRAGYDVGLTSLRGMQLARVR